MEMKFAELFNLFRLKAGYEKLSQFGHALANEGFVYEDTMFSRWKNGKRTPKNRKVILAIIRVFWKKESMTSIDQANALLHAASNTTLSSLEEYELIVNTPKPFEYNNNHRSATYKYLPLTEEDVIFLANKIVGRPYVLCNKDKIIRLAAQIEFSPKTVISLLRTIENNPAQLDTFITQTKSTPDLVRDQVKRISNEMPIFAILKKPQNWQFFCHYCH